MARRQRHRPRRPLLGRPARSKASTSPSSNARPGAPGTFEAQVTALQAPTRLALHGRDGDGVTIDIDAELAPAGDGTRLRWSIRIGLPLRYRMFESMARPQVERAAALDIEALQAPPGVDRRRLTSVHAGWRRRSMPSRAAVRPILVATTPMPPGALTEA